jgi:hypothetical protein
MPVLDYRTMVSPLRLLALVWLAVAQPLGFVLGHCGPLSPVTADASHCGHDDGAEPGDGSDEAQSPPCIGCCCLPGGALVAPRPDALGSAGAVRYSHVEAASAPLLLAAVPHLLPFAIAPPSLA